MCDDNRIYYTVNDVAGMLGISVGTSYRLIRKLNKELEKKGYIVIAGKLPIKYFEEKYYGMNTKGGVGV